MKFKEAAASEASKDFLRLKDGESVKGVLRGEPFEFKQHWVGMHTEVCKGEQCSNCKAGNKASFRFRINFIINDNGRYSPRILEQGWNLYKSLNNLNTDYDLEKHIVKLTRHGAGKNDTTYAVIPVPNGIITEEILNQIAPLKLLDLTKVGGEAAAETFADTAKYEDEVPF